MLADPRDADRRRAHRGGRTDGERGIPARRAADCAGGDARPRRRLLGSRGLADARDGHGGRDTARGVRVLHRGVGDDDGGDDAAGRGPGGRQACRDDRQGARRAAVRRVLPGRLGARRRRGVRAGPAARVAGRRRRGDRGRRLRAHAGQAALPPALPGRCRLRAGVRAMLRRLEHRADGGAGSAGRDEPVLDGGGRRPCLRPEAAAREGRDRRSAGAGDRRARARACLRALGGSGAHATSDVTTRNYKEGRQAMTSHKTGTREEWLAARLELLGAEKELTRHGDEVSRRRQELPWVRVGKDYRFETDEGTASLPDLFRGRSQLLVYHFMFGPDYSAGCPSCSAIADGFNGSTAHLAGHDVTLCAVSRAPLAKLHAYKRRMGWSFPWASSYGGDFNFDFGVAHTKQEWEAGAVAYNFGEQDLRPAAGEEDSSDAFSQSIVGTDWETYRREGPGMSAFALEDGTVYHTYSTYARGLDILWGMYQWLDHAPLGRNESGMWWRRHDEYDSQ